ncbi:MAG: DUF2520 domain-containing protein [Rikenellaceae bacterium]
MKRVATKRVVIVGGGNLAESVAIAIANTDGVELAQIYVRSAERATQLHALTGAATSTFEEPLAKADVYLLAVSDPAIGELSHTLHFAAGAVVAHTAGSSPIEVINSDLRRAVFYPMQTFTRARRVDFSVIPIFVEGCDAETLSEVRELAELLSSNVTEMGSEERRRLHLSAVYVCNFVNAMFIAGEELVSQSGLEFAVLKPLVEECCAKALDAASPRDVQTGPAARGDVQTIEKHIAMLSNNEPLQSMYQQISNYIWQTLKRI